MAGPALGANTGARGRHCGDACGSGRAPRLGEACSCGRKSGPLRCCFWPRCSVLGLGLPPLTSLEPHRASQWPPNSMSPVFQLGCVSQNLIWKTSESRARPPRLLKNSRAFSNHTWQPTPVQRGCLLHSTAAQPGSSDYSEDHPALCILWSQRMGPLKIKVKPEMLFLKYVNITTAQQRRAAPDQAEPEISANFLGAWLRGYSNSLIILCFPNYTLSEGCYLLKYKSAHNVPGGLAAHLIFAMWCTAVSFVAGTIPFRQGHGAKLRGWSWVRRHGVSPWSPCTVKYVHS